MNRKILCVDDDINILSGYKRSLRKEFDIVTAEGGEEGLAAIANVDEEFAVVISDMQMPGMNGVQFLQRAMKESPNTVRIMLTGNADQQTATDAVNEGNIFRFLTKPCDAETLTKVLNAGLEQFYLVTAEKQILSETLNSSLQVMVEILSMVNPMAFSRANRIKKMARDIAKQLGVKKIWEVEVAAMLSQIGCITVPEETLQKISNSQPLGEQELQLFSRHPQVAHDLIAQIPRMGTVAQIIANQNRRMNDVFEVKTVTPEMEEARYGARILKVVLDFDKKLEVGSLPHQAYKEMVDSVGWYDPIVLGVLKELIDKASSEFVNLEIDVKKLQPGMLLSKAVYSSRRTLLLSAGQDVTPPLIIRLINFAATGMMEPTVHVSVPLDRFQVAELCVPSIPLPESGDSVQDVSQVM